MYKDCQATFFFLRLRLQTKHSVGKLFFKTQDEYVQKFTHIIEINYKPFCAMYFDCMQNHGEKGLFPLSARFLQAIVEHYIHVSQEWPNTILVYISRLD